MNKIRLIVVDDHPIFIEGIFALLRNDERFDIVGFAHNGKDALELVKKPILMWPCWTSICRRWTE